MTRRLQVTPQGFDAAILDEAAAILNEGGIVVFPTETVYGVGAVADDEAAVARLTALKQRVDKPFSYHVADDAQLRQLVDELPAAARALADRYWPGPLTLVVPGAQGSESTIGIRMPAGEIARELIRATGRPVFVPSANPAGEAPALTADEAEAYFGDGVDLIIDGGTVQLKQSSTVVQVEDERFHILREGIISREMVHQLICGKTFLFVCTGNTCRSPMAAALFRKHLAAKLGKSADDLEEVGYQILSAGTFAMPGAHASGNATEIMRERGCDLSGHRSQPVSVDLLGAADRVYALGPSHLEVLLQVDPEHAGRFQTLAEDGIVDPIGGSLEIYRRCADEIERAVVKLLENWS